MLGSHLLGARHALLPARQLALQAGLPIQIGSIDRPALTGRYLHHLQAIPMGNATALAPLFEVSLGRADLEREKGNDLFHGPYAGSDLGPLSRPKLGPAHN